MVLAWAESAARQFEPGKSVFATPGALAKVLDPRTINTPALDLIDTHLVRVAETPESRLCISVAPQEGKTWRAVRDFIIWTLLRDPDTRIILGSYNQRRANQAGRLVRNAIETHPELGLKIAADNGAKGEWSIEGHKGGLVSVGRGVGVAGVSADLVIIDDPFKEGEAQSALIREAAWEWWTEGIASRFGATTRVVVIHTRWHIEDLIGQLLAKDAHAGWIYLNIPAQADHDPAKGQTDPLGRQPGEFMISARGRTRKQWEQRKLTAGTRVWNALYQGRPTPAEGNIVQRAWWRKYATPLWMERADGSKVTMGAADQLIISCDMAFKAKTDSDFVVLQVWMRRGVNAYLLDQIRGRIDFVETCRQLVHLSNRWPQALLKIVEAAANGPAVMAQLANTVPGLVPEIPRGSKESRLSACAPLIEAGNVWLPDPESDVFPWAWVDDFIDEVAAFPHGSVHDDQVDACSQALDRLLVQPLLAGEDLLGDGEGQPEEFDELDAQGYVYSQY